MLVNTLVYSATYCPVEGKVRPMKCLCRHSRQTEVNLRLIRISALGKRSLESILNAKLEVNCCYEERSQGPVNCNRANILVSELIPLYKDGFKLKFNITF
jgi:hypothetical protein